MRETGNDIKKLKEDIHYLKMIHDKEYALEYQKQELLKTYNKLVGTDIWYKAIQKYIDNKINNIFNFHWDNFESRYCLIFSELREKTNYENSIVMLGTHNSTGYISYNSMSDFSILKDSIKSNIHKIPEIEGYYIEKFVINYAKNNK